MKTITKTIMVSSLFSLSGMTNCVAAASWFSLEKWASLLAGDDIYLLEKDRRDYFFEIEKLYHYGVISKLDFAKAVVWVFRNQATKAKGLVDILCDQCEILVGSEDYTKLIIFCLRNPSLEDVPILILDISEKFVDEVKASKDPCTNPHPDFCRAVMEANSLEEVVTIFDTFNEKFKTSKGLGTDQKILAEQSKIYAKATVFRMDMPRNELGLMIGKREISIPKDIFQDSTKDVQSTQGIFQVVLDWLQKPEAEGGAGLDNVNAFYVFKQVALAYRGQNGVADGFSLINAPLMGVSENNLSIKFNGVGVSMKFEEQGGHFVLMEKSEYSPILGVRDISKDAALVTPKVRFNFPGDSEIGTQLLVTSTRIPSTDGTIEWSCPFRENPPRQVILYGGCTPTNPH
jgi:hypothetical protein